MDRKRLAQTILTGLATGAAEFVGGEAAKRLWETLRDFLSSDPTPGPVYEAVHGGARFQVSKDVFIRQELPKNIEFLLALPAERVRALVGQAQRIGASSPEQVLTNLVRLVQEERVQQAMNRR